MKKSITTVIILLLTITLYGQSTTINMHKAKIGLIYNGKLGEFHETDKHIITSIEYTLNVKIRLYMGDYYFDEYWDSAKFKFDPTIQSYSYSFYSKSGILHQLLFTSDFILVSVTTATMEAVILDIP